jgi:hypothetical protein
MAGTFNQANIAADFRYTDWTQMDFDYDSPELDVAENDALRFIQDELTEVSSASSWAVSISSPSRA